MKAESGTLDEQSRDRAGVVTTNGDVYSRLERQSQNFNAFSSSHLRLSDFEKKSEDSQTYASTFRTDNVAGVYKFFQSNSAVMKENGDKVKREIQRSPSKPQRSLTHFREGGF